MPTFQSVAAFNAEINRLQRTIEQDTRAATKAMAEEGEKIAGSEARGDLGGDDQFSGWNGRYLEDLRVKRSYGGTGHFLLPTRKSGGPWKVAEQGRNKGTATGRGGVAVFFGPGLNRKTGMTSRTKSGAVRKVRAFGESRWNGYTAGKGTATHAVARFEKAAQKIADKSMRTAIAKHFD